MSSGRKRQELSERVERLERSVEEARARLEHTRIEAHEVEQARVNEGETELTRSERIGMGLLAGSWGLAFLGYLALFVGQCASCAVNARRDHTYQAVVVGDDGDGSEVGNRCEVVLAYARDEPCDVRLRCGSRQLFEGALPCQEVDDSISETTWIAIADGPLIVDPNHGWARWSSERPDGATIELLLVDHDEDAW